MKKLLEKRILSLIITVCLLVSMIVVAINFAGATASRLDNWNGYITTTLNITGRANVDATTGYHLTLSESELYVGDSIKTNYNWLSYAINFDKDGTPANAKISGTQNWYCDDVWQFSSQLYYGKINGTSNNDAQKFEKAGTWVCKSSMEGGGEVVLIAFVVNPLDEEPSSNSATSTPTSTPTTSGTTSSDTSSSGIDHGTENPSIDYSPRTINISTEGGNVDDYEYSYSNPSNLVNFETSTIMVDGEEFAAFLVGDNLQNTHWWIDYMFKSPTGNDVRIYDVYLVCKEHSISQRMQVGYGHGDFTFEKAGEYTLVTNIGGTEYELARFHVFWPSQDIVDQFKFDLTPEKYLTYTVLSGIAEITDCDTEVSGDITIPSTLGGYPVTSIGDDAFRYCSKLTSITIPDSVTSIGDYAFSGCSSLTSITIPDGITSIGVGMFSGCSNLTSVTIPDSVIIIGNSAFSGCSNLTSVAISDNVISIGDSAFFDCSNLTSVKIPDNVIIIGSSAFSGCSNLTSVTIPNSVVSIDSRAFYKCSGLTSITIPDSVISIGSTVFFGCVNLKTVYNLSPFNIVKGSTTLGYVAYYADEVITDDGDCDGDGEFTSADLLSLQQHIMGLSSLVVPPDLNEDGVTDTADLALVQMKILGY